MPDIAQAAVVARGRTEEVRALCAFVVLAQGVTAFDEAAVRAELARSLPPHLVPTVVRVLPALPETASGKTDRKALPDPFDAATVGAVDSPVDSPGGSPGGAERRRAGSDAGADRAVAAVTAEIWSRVLRCEAAGLDASSDFHALGGDSLAVLEMLSALGEELLGGSAERRLLDRLGPLSGELTLGRVVAAVNVVRSEA
ncbi:AMP-binding enzyme [Kitasatospora sp. NPDC001660]